MWTLLCLMSAWLLCVLCSPALAAEAETVRQWSIFSRVAASAKERGDFGLAEKMYAEAIERAESFGESDKRLINSIVCLATTYSMQNKHWLAMPLFSRLSNIALRQPTHRFEIKSLLAKQQKVLSDAGDVADSLKLAACIQSIEEKERTESTPVADIDGESGQETRHSNMMQSP